MLYKLHKAGKQGQRISALRCEDVSLSLDRAPGAPMGAAIRLHLKAPAKDSAYQR